MIVVDSSGWLEYFGAGQYAEEFAARLEHPANVLTPTVALYEVYKVAKRDRSAELATDRCRLQLPRRRHGIFEEEGLIAPTTFPPPHPPESPSR